MFNRITAGAMATTTALTSVIAVMMIVALSSVGGYAQTLTVPPQVDLFQFARADRANNFTAHPEPWAAGLLVGRNGYTIYTIQSARIWGWSQNGRVAYSIETIEPNGPTMMINFIIQNLVTDAKVFEHRIWLEMDENFNIEQLYTAHADTLRLAMQAHNIIARQVDFRPFPIARNDMTYDVEINATYINRDRSVSENRATHGHTGRIREYGVVIRNSGGQSKTITTVRDVNLMDVYIGGYFLSPYENRAMVVMVEKVWMPMDGTRLLYRLIGSHLGTGFR